MDSVITQAESPGIAEADGESCVMTLHPHLLVAGITLAASVNRVTSFGLSRMFLGEVRNRLVPFPIERVFWAADNCHSCPEIEAPFSRTLAHCLFSRSNEVNHPWGYPDPATVSERHGRCVPTIHQSMRSVATAIGESRNLHAGDGDQADNRRRSCRGTTHDAAVSATHGEHAVGSAGSFCGPDQPFDWL